LIVRPSVNGGRDVGADVQSAIETLTGVRIPLVDHREVVKTIPAWPDASMRGRPLILIGHIGTNNAIVPLYGNLLAAADADYPGGDGYTLRTAVDPYGAGVNQIVLGASSAAGAERAVRAFVEIARQHAKTGHLTLPGLLTIIPGGTYREIVERTAKPDKKSAALGLDYHWTGHQALLDAALKELRASPFMKPEAKSYNPGHYSKEFVVRKLIALIRSGALTPDEVNHIDNILLQGLHEEYDGYWIVHEANWLGTRHQTMGMMAFLVTADYLLNHARPNAEATAFLTKCVEQGHAFFRQFERNYRDEGNDNSSFDSTGPVCRYMMAYGNTRFFATGSARLMALRALMMTDNRGWFAAPGNYEDTRQGKMGVGIDTRYAVGIPAFVYRDARLKWIMENAAGFGPMVGGGWGYSSGIACGRYPVGSEVKATEPDVAWCGVTRLPLQSYYYDLCGHYMTHGAARRKHAWEPLIPRDKAVEMLAFRDRFGRAAPYLFISGYQGGRYNSIDANAIVRYADRGHVWLVSQTEQLGHYFRNALHVGTTYRPDYLAMPGTIRLDASVSFDDVGMTATTLPNANRANWTRHVLWARGRYFLVIDTATFLQDGDYDLTCTWQSLPIAAMESGAWVSRFLGARFELRSADAVDQSAYHSRPRSTEQLCVHPYTFRQHKAIVAKKGERFSFRNLFWTQSRDAGEGYTVKPVGTDAVIVSDGRGYVALAGVGLSGLTDYGPISTDARMFLVSTESVRVVPEMARIALNGKPLRPGKPAGALADALRRLYRSAPRPGAPPTRPTSTAGSVRTAWTHRRFARLHQEVSGVSVVDPKGIEPPDALFDRQIRLWSSPVEWPKDAKTVTYDLGRVEDIARIHLETSYTHGKPAVWRQKDKEAVTLGFSNDGFKRDVREQALVPDRVYRQDPPYIYKPYRYNPKTWLAFQGQGEGTKSIRARYVRTPAKASYETRFYRAVTHPAAFDWLEPVDLDGDGREEIAVATEACELVVLNDDGSLRWTRRLANTVTALHAADLDGDGTETLFVADNGWDITGYDAAGKTVYHVDCHAAKVPGAYALGTVLPKGAVRRYLVVATGMGAVVLDVDGKIYCELMGGGVCSDVVLAGTSSSPRARHRSASRSAWGAGVCRDIALVAGERTKQTEVRRACGGGGLGCYWWLGLGFEFWPEADAPKQWRDGLAVFVARAGVNAYDLGATEPATRWSLPANGPISAYAFANMDGVAGKELVLGRLDGFVDVVDRSGKVIDSWPVRAPVKDLCAWHSAKAVIAVATGESLCFYNRDGKEAGRMPLAAEKLAVLRSGERLLLICADRNGGVTALARREN